VEAPAASGAAAPSVTDPQIAATVVAANAVDVQAGEVALGKASNPEVRGFAQRMVTDRNGVNKTAVALITKLGVMPVESPTSMGLTASGDSTCARLATLSGAEFDGRTSPTRSPTTSSCSAPSTPCCSRARRTPS
jgi:putative membrane protein